MICSLSRTCSSRTSTPCRTRVSRIAALDQSAKGDLHALSATVMPSCSVCILQTFLSPPQRPGGAAFLRSGFWQAERSVRGGVDP
eukprot:scaffold1472_cov300-Pinguiococcus_pyrenoidosus.AAC.5